MKKSLLIKLFATLLSLCFLLCVGVACGGSEDEEEHKHSYTQEVQEEKFYAEAPDCEHGALYYYSCKCGKKGKETFEVGKGYGHDYSTYQLNDGYTHILVCANDQSHTVVEDCYGGDATCSQSGTCEVCLSSYYDLDNHLFENEYVQDEYKASEATCTKPAQYYYVCECGEVGTETFGYGDTIPHTYDQRVESDNFAYVLADCQTIGEYYYSCVCGDFDMYGNTFVGALGTHRIYSDFEDLYTVENDENYPFSVSGRVIQSTNHYDNSSSTYTVIAQGNIILSISYSVSSESGWDEFRIYYNDNLSNYISGEYSNLKAQLNLKKGDRVDFTYSKDGSGTNGDDCACFSLTALAYVQVEDLSQIQPLCEDDIHCEVCGEFLVAAKGHEYELEVVDEDYLVSEATCSTPAKYYKICECGEVGTETFEYGDTLEHPYFGWDSDEDEHWQNYTCACEIEPIKEGHIDDGYGYCEVCDRPLVATSGVVYSTYTDGNGDAYAMVVAYEGSETSVLIAEEFEGAPVTHIGVDAFYNSPIENIILPSTITTIEENAFAYSNIESITIPENVTSIERGAFYCCYNLEYISYNATEFIIEDTFLDIFKYAGSYPTGITLTVGANVKSIPEGLFGDVYSSDAPKITDVIFKSGSVCESIEENAFFRNMYLKNVTLPSSVSNITGAFMGCTELENLSIDEENEYLVEIDGCVYTKDMQTLMYALSSLQKVEIKDGTLNIASYAFAYSDVAIIKIPDSISFVDEYAFYECYLSLGIYMGTIESWNKVTFGEYNSSLVDYFIGFPVGEMPLDEEVSVSVTEGIELYLYSFTPQEAGEYYFSSSNDSNLDTRGYLFDEDFNVVTDDDDSGDGNNFSLHYWLDAGQTYYFGVRMYSFGYTGQFNIVLKK